MTKLSTATAIGLILVSSPSLAEITPASVWEQMVSYYETSGIKIQTESLDQAGTALTARGVLATQEAQGVKLSINVGDVILTPTGDGGVNVDTPDKSELDVTIDGRYGESETHTADSMDSAEPAPSETAPEDEATTQAPPKKSDIVTISITLNSPGETITVYEDDSKNRYDYNFPTLEVKLNSVAKDSDKLEDLASIVFTKITGSSWFESGPLSKVTQKGQVESVDAILHIATPDGTKADGKLSVAGSSWDGNSITPTDKKLYADFSDLMRAGLQTTGSLNFGEQTGEFMFAGKNEDGEDFSVSINTSAEPATLHGSVGDGRVKYSGKGGASSFEVKASPLPAPISYKTESTNFNIEIPVLASSEPQSFKLAYGFNDLTLSDSVWDLFDQQAVLPRDPAQIAIDLDGEVLLNVDITDPGALDQTAPPPGKINTLNINKAEFYGIGTSIEVTGKLSGPEGGNLTNPAGTLTGKLSGVNELLDNLTKIGLLPQDKAIGIRMMTAMFTKPDPEDPNKMTSEIEFKENGQIFANGQQIK